LGRPGTMRKKGAHFVRNFLIICPELEKRRRWNPTDAERVGEVVEQVAKDFEPNLRGVSGDLEMDDSPSMVIKYNHGIEHPKCRGHDDEHVDRDDDRHMVPQKAAPSWGGGLRAPRQIPSNGGLTDLDAELEEFAVNTRCAPKRTVEAHLTDQVAISSLVLGRAGSRDRHRQ
jgi:hypothetical protein